MKRTAIWDRAGWGGAVQAFCRARTWPYSDSKPRQALGRVWGALKGVEAAGAQAPGQTQGEGVVWEVA